MHNNTICFVFRVAIGPQPTRPTPQTRTHMRQKRWIIPPNPRPDLTHTGRNCKNIQNPKKPPASEQ